MDTLTRNWFWVVLRGVVAILFGMLALFNPGIALGTLVLWFGIYAIMDGVFKIISAVANRHNEPQWMGLLTGGILGLFAGLIALFLPSAIVIAMVAFIAVWALVTGFAEIMAGVRLRKDISGEWMLILAGLAGMAFGAFLILRPGAGALAIVLWVGIYALISGILLVSLGFRLRSWSHGHFGSTPHPA